MTTRGRDVGVGERAGEDEGEDGRGRGAGFNSPSRSMRCARRETRDAREGGRWRWAREAGAMGGGMGAGGETRREGRWTLVQTSRDAREGWIGWKRTRGTDGER